MVSIFYNRLKNVMRLRRHGKGKNSPRSSSDSTTPTNAATSSSTLDEKTLQDAPRQAKGSKKGNNKGDTHQLECQKSYLRRWRLLECTWDGVRVFAEEVNTFVDDGDETNTRGHSASWLPELSPIAVNLCELSVCGVLFAVVTHSWFMGASFIIVVAFLCIFCAPRGGGRHGQQNEEFEKRSLSRHSTHNFGGLMQPNVWEPTGQVRVSVLIDAGITGEELFHLITGCKREGEWSADFEDKRIVKSLDPHTDIIETIERTPWSCRLFRKLLAYNARYDRRMRYWKVDDDGGYSIVSQSVDSNWSLNQFHVHKKVCGIVASETKGHVIEIRPVNNGHRGYVVTEALEIDTKLSPLSALFCEAPPAWCSVPPTSILAVNWSATRIRDRLRGLRACAAQLIDEDPLHLCTKTKRKAFISQSSGIIDAFPGDEIPYIITPKIIASPDASKSREDATHQPKKSTSSPSPPRLKCDDSRTFKRSSKANVSEQNTWDESPYSQFQVRGHNYLDDGRKIPAGPTACDLIALDALRTETGKDLIDVGRRLVPTLKEGLLTKDDRLILINFMLPYESKNAPHVSLLFYFRVKHNVDPAFMQRLDAFCAATDKVRDETLKLIPFIQDGPWIAKHALGQKPALVGRGITTHYFQSSNFIEIDIDVGSSSVANGIWRIMKGAGKLLVTDIAFLFESKTRDQCPETLLGTARISHFEIANASNPAFTQLGNDFFHEKPRSHEDSKVKDKISHGNGSANSSNGLPPAHPTSKIQRPSNSNSSAST